MGFVEKVRRLIYIHSLIHSERSGCANEIAKKAGISRRTVMNYIELLRDMGGSIAYHPSKNSYIYTNSFHLDVKKF